MAECTYSLLVEKLGRLQRNEAQMTVEQKTTYADELKTLRKRIAGYAAETAREFILGGTLLKKDGAADECVKRIRTIVKSKQAEDEYRAAVRILFSTYDTNEFFKALLPTHLRVHYEGYAPYWLEHCEPYNGKSYSGKPLTFWNDIIEMGWNEKNSLWYKESGNVLSMALPPTQEQVHKKYIRELETLCRKG